MKTTREILNEANYGIEQLQQFIADIAEKRIKVTDCKNQVYRPHADASIEEPLPDALRYDVCLVHNEAVYQRASDPIEAYLLLLDRIGGW